MASTPPPDWRLPPGVTRGLWEYGQSDVIAADDEADFAVNRLFEFDEQVVLRHFTRPGVVADLGCGTGRLCAVLARRGFHCLAIDFSEKMLAAVRAKAAAEQLPIDCLRANLVELDGVADAVADYALCMFSTLGMIRGREHRRQALAHVRRLLRPGGLFVLHVHNYWFNLFDPGGPWWLVGNLLQAAWRKDVERGDKFFHYRGVHNMFLHVFTRRELVGELRRTGFRVVELIPLATNRQRRLPASWLLGGVRANGWIVVCR